MRLKLKTAPVIKMLGVTALVASIIVLIDSWFRSLPDYEILMTDFPWILSDLVHIPQFLIPLLLIYHITEGRLGEYGFNLREDPPLFTHRRMLVLGIASGLLMSLRYLSQIVRGVPLGISQPVNVVNVVGTMTFQWIVVGVCEETMFRGFIQTYLMNNLEGGIEMAGHELHIGTIIGAIFWGGFHFINMLVMPLGSTVFLVVLTTMIGVLMGYAYQRTGSLLTTMTVHNTLFGVPLTIGYLLYWLT